MKSTFGIIALFALMTCLSCKSKHASLEGGSAQTVDIRADTLAYMTRGACYGSCPVDTLLIRPDGRVEYRLRRTGQDDLYVNNYLSVDEINTLYDLIHQLSVQNIQAHYPVDRTHIIYDLPRYEHILKTQDYRYVITHINNGPAPLITYEKHLSALIKKLRKE